MARICSSCKYYDAGGEETQCPTCRTPLRFTLLPVPGQTPAPIPDLPEPSFGLGVRSKASQTHQIGEMLVWGFRHRWVWSLIVGSIVVVGGVFGMLPNTLEDKYDRIKIGMSAREVSEILKPVRSKRFPQHRNSTMDDFPEYGRATLDFQENADKMTILFLDGMVIDKSKN